METRKCLARVVAVVGIALLILVSPVQGQECPESLGQWSWGYGGAYEVAVSGTHAFVASIDGLHIVDISDPPHPITVSHVDIREAVHVTLSGSYAYVTNYVHVIEIVDVSDPAQPVQLATFRPGSLMFVESGYAYVASTDGLLIIDVSNPAEPVEASRLGAWGYEGAVAVSGHYAYVAGSRGLKIVDLSNPTAPVEVGRYLPPGNITAVAVAEGYAYTAVRIDAREHQQYALQIIDVSDSSHPIEVGREYMPTDASGLVVSGGFAYVSGAVLRIIDVSDPTEPFELGSAQVAGRDLAVSGGYAYVAADHQGLRIIDVSDPSIPTEIGVYRDYLGHSSTVAASDHHAFVATNLGLLILDSSDPTDLVQVGALDTAGYANDVALSGGHAFVATDYGLSIVEVSDLAHPVEVGHVATPSYAKSVAVSGSYAYITDSAGLRVIDVSDSSLPVEVSLFNGMEFSDVAVAGESVYLAAQGNLLTVDVSNPAQPVQLATYDSGGSIHDISVDGGYAYIASSNGLLIIDVSNPAEPAQVGRLVSSGETAQRVSLRGGHAYLLMRCSRPCDVLTRLAIVDISTPSDPVEVESHWFDVFYVFDLDVSRSRLYATGLGFAAFSNACVGRRWFEFEASGDRQGDSGWQTDVALLNRSALETNVDFIVHTPDGTTTSKYTIAGLSQRIFDGVSGSIDHDGGGVLEVRADQPITVVGRRYHRTGSGTFAHFVNGYSDNDVLRVGQSAWLLGLRQFTDLFGTNIIVTNVSGEPASVRVSLHTTDGTELTSYRLDVSPGGSVLDLEPFKNRAGRPDLGWGLAEISVESGRGVLPSASVVDSRTNDTTSVPVALEPSWHHVDPTEWVRWIEIAAHSAGQYESTWRTDIVAKNVTPEIANVDLVLHTPHGEVISATAIPPSNQAIFEDIVGFMDQSGKGPLEIRSDNPLMVAGKMYSESPSGTVGGSLVGYDPSEVLVAGNIRWLPGLRQLWDAYRTNINVTNAGDSSARVRITLFRTYGDQLTSYTLQVPPKGCRQDIEPFRRRALRPNLGWGFARVAVEEGEGVFVSASVIDSRTNDVVMVPMMR